MAVRGQRFTRIEEIFWILIAFCFFSIEIGAITQDRDQHDKYEAQTRAEETKHFETILAKNQGQFEATKSGIEKSIETVTGGNTYCYVIASPIGNGFTLYAVARGSSPLHEVTTDLIDVDVMRSVTAGKRTATLEDIQSFSTSLPILPFLSSSSTQILARIPVGSSPRRNLQFNFFSLNGNWSASLKLALINGEWAQAIRVIRYGQVIRGKQATKLLYSYSTDAFPKKDGKVDWDN
jgi:hypothetical protein